MPPIDDAIFGMSPASAASAPLFVADDIALEVALVKLLAAALIALSLAAAKRDVVTLLTRTEVRPDTAPFNRAGPNSNPSIAGAASNRACLISGDVFMNCTVLSKMIFISSNIFGARIFHASFKDSNRGSNASAKNPSVPLAAPRTPAVLRDFFPEMMSMTPDSPSATCLLIHLIPCAAVDAMNLNRVLNPFKIFPPAPP